MGLQLPEVAVDPGNCTLAFAQYSHSFHELVAVVEAAAKSLAVGVGLHMKKSLRKKKSEMAPYSKQIEHKQYVQVTPRSGAAAVAE